VEQAREAGTFLEAGDIGTQILGFQAAEPTQMYPVQLEPKEKDHREEAKKPNKDGMDEDTERQSAAQIWIIRFPNNSWGQTCGSTLWALHESGHLATLMEASVREDRAPRGSMCKALEDALSKSTVNMTAK